jgi:hypothetical protein
MAESHRFATRVCNVPLSLLFLIHHPAIYIPIITILQCIYSFSAVVDNGNAIAIYNSAVMHGSERSYFSSYYNWSSYT